MALPEPDIGKFVSDILNSYAYFLKGSFALSGIVRARNGILLLDELGDRAMEFYNSQK